MMDSYELFVWAISKPFVTDRKFVQVIPDILQGIEPQGGREDLLPGTLWSSNLYVSIDDDISQLPPIDNDTLNRPPIKRCQFLVRFYCYKL